MYTGFTLFTASNARHWAHWEPNHLLRLQFEGHPDLAEVDVRKMGNYWLKVTGDSLMLDGGIPAHMVNGQGRWRLHASDPPEMVYKYRQSDLETKLKTSNL